MGKNDNLSVKYQREGDARRPSDTLDRDQGKTESDRGKPAGFDPRTGEPIGSGSGAGGGKAGEDYDQDLHGSEEAG